MDAFIVRRPFFLKVLLEQASLLALEVDVIRIFWSGIGQFGGMFSVNDKHVVRCKFWNADIAPRDGCDLKHCETAAGVILVLVTKSLARVPDYPSRIHFPRRICLCQWSIRWHVECRL